MKKTLTHRYPKHYVPVDYNELRRVIFGQAVRLKLSLPVYIYWLEVDDLLQEGLAAAWKTERGHDKRSNCFGLCVNAARFKMINVVRAINPGLSRRKELRPHDFLLDNPTDIEELLAEHRTTSDAYTYLRGKELSQFVQRLPRRERIIVNYAILGYNQKDVAEDLDVTEPRITQLVRRNVEPHVRAYLEHDTEEAYGEEVTRSRRKPRVSTCEEYAHA